MEHRSFTLEFLNQCPIKDRQRFLDWAGDTRGRGIRTSEYAAIASGRPARAASLTLVIDYLLDESYRGNREAAPFREFLDARGVPAERRNPEALLVMLTEPAEAAGPFADALTSIKNFFDSACDPLRYVRPCGSVEEVRSVCRWLYLDVARRLANRNLSEPESLAIAADYLGMSLGEYQERRAGWWSASPWTIAVAGGSEDATCVGSIAGPFAEREYLRLRAGEIDSFTEPITLGVSTSSSLFVEGVARRPPSGRPFRWVSPVVHAFRLFICQQAALSDVPDLGESRPLRLLSPSSFEELNGWMRRAGYAPIGAHTPLKRFPLWERVLWEDERGIRESAHLGVWKGIQRSLRSRSQRSTASR